MNLNGLPKGDRFQGRPTLQEIVKIAILKSQNFMLPSRSRNLFHFSELRAIPWRWWLNQPASMSQLSAVSGAS